MTFKNFIYNQSVFRCKSGKLFKNSNLPILWDFLSNFLCLFDFLKIFLKSGLEKLASISKIYSSMNERAQLQGIIPTWGDAISWGDLHNYDKLSFNDWD